MHKPAKLPSLTTKRTLNSSGSRQFDEEPRVSNSKNGTKQKAASPCCGISFTDTGRPHAALTPRPPSFPRTRRENSLRTRSCSAPVAVKQSSLIRSQSSPDQSTFSSLNKSAFYNWKISEPSAVPATRKLNQGDGGTAGALAGVSSKQHTWLSSGEQRTRNSVIQKSINRTGTPIFKSLKKGDISVNSISVTATSESTKWQLCDITEIQNKQKENSNCFVDSLNIEAIHKSQQSSNSTDGSKTGRHTYVNEDNQNSDARRSKVPQSCSNALQRKKDNGDIFAEPQIDSWPANLKNENHDLLFGVTRSFTNCIHSCSHSFCTCDSEENNNLVCESDRDERYCCGHQEEEEEEEEEDVKRTRISNWIVQVSEKTKYIK